jgi:hypothetical protein
MENWLRLVEKQLARRASLGRDKIFGVVRVGFGLPSMHFVPTGRIRFRRLPTGDLQGRLFPRADIIHDLKNIYRRQQIFTGGVTEK